MAEFLGGQSALSTLDQTSAFGAKPQQVDAPVPGEQEQQELVQATGLDAQPEIQLSPEEEADQFLSADDEAAAFLGEPVGVEPGQEQPLEMEEDQGPVRNFANQFKDSLTRAKLSFAVTDKERSGLLNKILGEGNVERRDGKFFIRDKKKDKFRELDPFTSDVINDVLDFSREAVEEVVALPFEAAGAASGLLAGPAAPAAAAGGVIAGRALSVPAQIKVADAVGEWLGIERDPERSFAVESAVGTALNTAIPLAGSKLGNMLANRRSAKRVAKQAKHVQMRQNSHEFEQITNELKEAGLVQNIPGTDTPFLIWQLHPDDPKANVLRKHFEDTPVVQNMITKQGEAAQGVLRDMAEQVGDTAGKIDIDLSKEVVNIAKKIRDAEGEQLGKFRLQAAANVGENTKAPPMPEVTEGVVSLIDGLGITKNKAGKFALPKDIKPLLGNLGISDESQYRSIGNAVTQLANAGENGLSLKDYKKLVTVIGDRVPTARKTGGPISQVYGKLASDLRTSWNEAVKDGLEDVPGAADAFDAARNKFTNILDTQGSLARSLNDELTGQAFVKKIITEGKTDKDAMKLARAMLQKDHPDVWRKLTGDIMVNIMDKVGRENKATGFNSKAFAKELKSYGKDFTREMFEGSGVDQKDFMKMLHFTQRLERTEFSALGKDAGERMLNNISLFASKSPALHAKAVLNLLRIGKDRNADALKMLQQEGIDKFLNRVPKKDWNKVRKVWTDTIAFAKASGLMASKVELREDVQNVLGLKPEKE